MKAAFAKHVRHAAVVLALALVQAGAGAEIPGALVTRLYTEALGRAPDAAGWSSMLSANAGRSCTLAMAKAFGRRIFASAEYLAIRYDTTEQVLTMYRGLLGREPDPRGFADHVAALDAGRSRGALVNDFVETPEFRSYASNADGSCKQRLAWGALPALSGLHKGPGFHGSQAELQARLNSLSASGGGTLFLAQRAVIQLHSRLEIPDNVRLATYDLPTHRHYAKQARLVRASLFADVVVSVGRIGGGGVKSALESVWVSGQRTSVGFGPNTTLTGNILVPGGSQMLVKNVRSDTAAGWSTLYLHGSAENRPCGSASVLSNLTVGYGAGPYEPVSDKTWTDGISNACENALIADNHVVDPTDVGIVVFRSTPAPQRSLVQGNLIVSGGLPVIAALAVEPLGGAGPHDFSGTRFLRNSFFAAPDQFALFGISVGTRQWGADRQPAAGPTFSGNTNAGIATRMQAGIYVDSAIDAVVQANDLRRSAFAHPLASSCAAGDFVANDNQAYASGSFSPAPALVAMSPACLR